MTPKNSNQSLFKKWLRENRSSFPLKLKLAKSYQKSDLYLIKSIPNFRITISEAVLSVGVFHKAQFVDYLLDLEVYVKQNSKGRYYCEWCKDVEHRNDSYKTKEELLIKHTFKPFLRWYTQKVKDKNWLVMKKDGDFYEARITSLTEVRKQIKIILAKKKFSEGKNFIVFRELINAPAIIYY